MATWRRGTGDAGTRLWRRRLPLAQREERVAQRPVEAEHGILASAAVLAQQQTVGGHVRVEHRSCLDYVVLRVAGLWCA